MTKFNVDEQKSLFEPIEITLEGKEYVIEKVTTEMLDAVSNAATEEGTNGLLQQLSVLLGTEPKELSGVDVRKLGAVSRFLTETITKQIENPKNSSGDEAKQ